MSRVLSVTALTLTEAFLPKPCGGGGDALEWKYRNVRGGSSKDVATQVRGFRRTAISGSRAR
jgi:hypothetical protein